MSAERLLKYYDKIADAPDAINRLRRFILDLAVRGKLVPQDPNDESASELLKRITKEKARLMIAGDARKSEIDPVFSEDAPFLVPMSWKWTRLGSIGDWGSGSTPPRGNPDFYGGGIPWLKSGELNDNRALAGSKETVTQLAIDSGSFRLNKPGDVLLAMYGATIGKVAILAESAVTNQAVCGCTPFSGVDSQFLFFFLLSQREQFHSASEGGAQPNISKIKIIWTPIPLPPLAEQHRIVAKVDELMALCDQLEAARAKREATRDQFVSATLDRLTQGEPESFKTNSEFAISHLALITQRQEHVKRLRKTILDLAVRGKLVPQKATDGTADDLLMTIDEVRAARIKSGELGKSKGIAAPPLSEQMFAIPSNWAWTVADHVWDFENGDRSANYPSKDQLVPSGIPFINAGHLVNRRISYDDMNFITPDKFQILSGGKIRQGDQIYCLRGSLGKHALVEQETQGAIASSLVILRPVLRECVPYLEKYLDSDVAQVQLRRFDNGTAQPNLSSANLRRFEIPFPPLAEQRRIVAKVDALMALCDQLENSLTTETELRSRLLEATLSEALGTPDREAA